MQFSRAHFFVIGLDHAPGGCLVSVWANMASLALEYSTHLERDSMSIGLSFQLRVRSFIRPWKRSFLHGVADREPVFDQDDARADRACVRIRDNCGGTPGIRMRCRTP